MINEILVMFVLVVLLLVTALIMPYVIYSLINNKELQYKPKTVISIIVVCVVLSITFGIYDLGFRTKVNNLVKENNIYSLDLNRSISGSFVLGSGRIKNTLSFCFYEKSSGLYQIKCTDASKTFIKITKNNTARIKMYENGYILTSQFYYIIEIPDKILLMKIHF